MLEFVGSTIRMPRGDTGTFPVWYEDEETKIKIPLVTGDRVAFTVKRNANDPDSEALIQKFVTTFVDGVATVRIDPLDTKFLEFGRYFYDCEIKLADGTVHTLTPEDAIFRLGKEITHG